MNLADENMAKQPGANDCAAPSFVVAASQDFTMDLPSEEEKTSQPEEPESKFNQQPHEKYNETVENPPPELQNLEAAPTEKVDDVLAPLEEVREEEHELSFEGNLMDAERPNKTIESLTGEIDDLAEQLRNANLNIDQLSGANGVLNDRLRQQHLESNKLFRIYDQELKSKVILVELYKENSDDYKAQTDELTDGIHELQRTLHEVIDEYGMLETRLKECELDHQKELNAKEESITQLQQELKDVNHLFSGYDRDRADDTTDAPIDLSFVPDHPKTFTETYSQWRSVVKQLQDKETELKRLSDEMKDRAIHFDKQQEEMEQIKMANRQLVADKNCLLVEKAVDREELESSRSRCDLLREENDKLKLFGKDYLTKLFPNDQPDQKFDLPVVPAIGKTSNIVELEQENEKLLAIINNLMEKLHQINRNDVKVPGNDIPVVGTTIVSQCDNYSAQKHQTENFFLIEELKQDNVKLQSTIHELNAEKNVHLCNRTLSDARYDSLNGKYSEQKKENEKYVSIVKDLRAENENLSTQLSTVQDRLEEFVNDHRTVRRIKNALMVEVATLKQELIHEKAVNKALGCKFQSLKSKHLLGRNSLQLTASKPGDSIAKRSSQRNPSAQSSDRKRKSTTATEEASSMAKKRQLAGTVDSSGESDEDAIIDVGEEVNSFECDQLNIKLQYLSAVKTRKQARFILDAFQCNKAEGGNHDKSDHKGSNDRQSTGKSRSSTNAGTSRRSHFAGAKDKTSNADYQQTKGTRNKDSKADDGRNNKHRQSLKRSRSDERIPHSIRSQSAIDDHRHSGRRERSNVEQSILHDCYIKESTISGGNPVPARVSSRTSRRLISRYSRLARAQDQKSRVTIPRCNVLPSTMNGNKQSDVDHQKGNVDRQHQLIVDRQDPPHGDEDEDESEYSSINRRRSQRIKGHQQVIVLE